jgi:hypothetical protein
MPYLGDYLGQLLSEISIARMQADLETVRLAELYASHPLLRTFPVPHVRLPEVDLEVPVLVKTSEEPRAGESPRGGAKILDLGRKFDEILGSFLPKMGISITSNDRKKLRAALDERLTPGAGPTEIAIDVNRIADDLTTTALRVLGELKPSATMEAIVPPTTAAEIRETVRAEFLKLRTPPPRLTVLVTSAELREVGTAENIMRLRLKVSEQGLEWTSIESEGGRRDRLVPE